MSVRTQASLLLAGVSLLASVACAGAQICQGFGPQAPRDITRHGGTNPVVYSPALPAAKLSLCDLHFHKNAEHKGPEFDTFVGPDKFGGFRCNGEEPGNDVDLQHCANVSPGDTIEAHWAYTSCDVDPAPTLDSCLPDACRNPQLRVETQVFFVTRTGGVDFGEFTPTGKDTVTYLGSTTGPEFNRSTCSPVQVTWSVPGTCMPVDFDSLGRWCADNEFDEHYAHGVRALVEDEELLSEIPKAH